MEGIYNYEKGIFLYAQVDRIVNYLMHTINGIYENCFKRDIDLSSSEKKGLPPVLRDGKTTTLEIIASEINPAPDGALDGWYPYGEIPETLLIICEGYPDYTFLVPEEAFEQYCYAFVNKYRLRVVEESALLCSDNRQ